MPTPTFFSEFRCVCPGSLTVVLGPRDPEQAMNLLEAHEAIEKASAMLRREVAAETTRKEVPNLHFLVLPTGAVKLEE